jgi:ubiquinone/menaquinone biosynthesis C-methylase UbiE
MQRSTGTGDTNTMNTQNNSGQAWDNFWRGSQTGGDWESAGPQDAALEQFWLSWIPQQLEQLLPNPRLLDIGCGSGAVAGFATQAATALERPLSIYCCDQSAAALELLQSKQPQVETLCGDATQLPVPDGHFHLLSSQYGIEYAGVTAATEAARVLAPGGRLAFIMHYRGGAIDAECREALAALEQALASGMLPAFATFFHEHGKLRGNTGSVAAFEAADKALAPTVQQVAGILRQHGPDIAGGTIARLYKDVAHMYQRLKHYQPQDVITWTREAEHTLAAYAARNRSMLEAALDEAGLSPWVQALQDAGLSVASPTTLGAAGHEQPAAWIVTARHCAP